MINTTILNGNESSTTKNKVNESASNNKYDPLKELQDLFTTTSSINNSSTMATNAINNDFGSFTDDVNQYSYASSSSGIPLSRSNPLINSQQSTQSPVTSNNKTSLDDLLGGFNKVSIDTSSNSQSKLIPPLLTSSGDNSSSINIPTT